MADPNSSCPYCGSTETRFRKKREDWACDDCERTWRDGTQPVAKPRRIFLSYGRDQHAPFAARLKADLIGRGHEVWFDADRLHAGSDWEARIEEGLSWAAQDLGSGRFILLMTPHSVRMPDGFCLNEIARAIQLGLIIIPIIVEECLPPISICRLQWLDMQDCIPVESCLVAYSQRLDALMEILSRDELQLVPAFSAKPNPVVGLRPAEAGSDFVDRETEIGELRRILSDRALKCVVIVGRGGVGKTALLAKLCAEIESGEFQMSQIRAEMGTDGIVYLSCRRSDNPSIERLFSDIGQMLGSPHAEDLACCVRDSSRSAADKTRFLLGKLRRGSYVLVLDNSEDLLAADHRIADPDMRAFLDICLSTPHALKVVATCRERVRVDEQAGQAIDFVELNRLDNPFCISLLRALDRNGAMGLKDASDEVLGTVADRCLGNPFALKKVAGILRGSEAPTLEQLMQDTDLFEHTVEANLVEFQYNGMSQDEQRVLEALAVCGTPVARDAVQYLLEGFLSPATVSECLTLLVDSYFATYRKALRTYELHPIDRKHAYSRIPDGGERYTKESLHARAAEFYRTQRKPEPEIKAIDDLEPQMQEFHHLVESRQFNAAAELLDSIDESYLDMWGYYTFLAGSRQRIGPGITERQLVGSNAFHLGSALSAVGDLAGAMTHLEQAQTVGRDLDDPVLQGRSLVKQGDIHRALGKWEQADKCYSAGLRLLEAADHGADDGRSATVKKALIAALVSLGQLRARRGDCGEGRALMERALALATQLGDHRSIAWANDELGELHFRERQFDDALEHYLDSKRLKELTGNSYGLAIAFHHLGDVYAERGDHEQSIQCYCQSLELKRNMGAKQEEADTLHEMGWVYACMGRRTEALESLGRSLELKKQIGNVEGQVATLQVTASALLCPPDPDPEAAICYYEQALRLAEEMGDAEGISHIQVGMAIVQQDRNCILQAKDHLRAALESGSDGRAPAAYLYALAMMAVLHEQERDFAAAVDYRDTHVAEVRKTGSFPALLEALCRFGDALAACGNQREAAHSWQEALSIASTLGDETRCVELRSKLDQVET